MFNCIVKILSLTIFFSHHLTHHIATEVYNYFMSQIGQFFNVHKEQRVYFIISIQSSLGVFYLMLYPTVEAA